MIAVEIGFGDVKVIGEGIKLKFPTVVAYARSGALKEMKLFTQARCFQAEILSF